MPGFETNCHQSLLLSSAFCCLSIPASPRIRVSTLGARRCVRTAGQSCADCPVRWASFQQSLAAAGVQPILCLLGRMWQRLSAGRDPSLQFTQSYISPSHGCLLPCSAFSGLCLSLGKEKMTKFQVSWIFISVT